MSIIAHIYHGEMPHSRCRHGITLNSKDLRRDAKNYTLFHGPIAQHLRTVHETVETVGSENPADFLNSWQKLENS